MPSKPGSYLGAMAKLREQFGGRCSECGCTEPQAKLRHRNGLEFAHVITTTLNGRGRGRADRYHDIVRNPSHYRLMCWTCHREFDRTIGPKLPEEVPF